MDLSSSAPTTRVARRAHRGAGPVLLALGLLGWGLPLPAADDQADEPSRSVLGPLMHCWDERPVEAARSIGGMVEFSDSGESLCRVYPHRDWPFLGARPFCLSLHGDRQRIRQVVVVYSNQFDPASLAGGWMVRTDDLGPRQQQLTKAVNSESAAIARSLTRAFGPGHLNSTGDNRIDRWWVGAGSLIHEITGPGAYVLVTLTPRAGPAPRARSAPDREPEGRDRVRHRDNGDVVIAGLPLVDQGRGDFCGPATWERCLRYRGLPGDMYLLGMEGHAQWNGRLRVGDLEAAVQRFAQRHGHEIEAVSPDLTLSNLGPYLAHGLPVVWACNDPPDLEREISLRSDRRRSVTDWGAYRRDSLAFQRGFPPVPPARMLRLQQEARFGHLRLITGYNSGTGELAISDSFGPRGEERWMTLAEAKMVSLDYLRILR